MHPKMLLPTMATTLLIAITILYSCYYKINTMPTMITMLNAKLQLERLLALSKNFNNRSENKSKVLKDVITNDCDVKWLSK